MIYVKRVYDEPAKADGYRVLVDRLWPRGMAKERAHLDAWLKDIAPSPELRIWFNHEDEKFEEFSQRYRAELEHNPAVEELRQIVREHPATTLIYAAKSPQVNHAVVLQQFLQH
jgi:uncharacterized protein YeaO (DUF488 family)